MDGKLNHKFKLTVGVILESAGHKRSLFFSEFGLCIDEAMDLKMVLLLKVVLVLFSGWNGCFAYVTEPNPAVPIVLWHGMGKIC